MENICQANHCSNVIRGRRKDARYCSESCKQVQKRYNKANGITGSISRRSAVPVKIDPTGSLVNDAAVAASIGLLSNGGSDAVSTITGNVMQSCIPYALKSIKERPIASLLFAFGGYKAASSLFKSCTTTITKSKSGRDVSSKSCKPASPLHKTGGAALAVLGANHLLDAMMNLHSANMATSDTGQTRVRHGSTPNNTSDTMQRILANIKANPDIQLFKAN